ncbi:MAG: DUF4132 domain-containing protein [Polyangiales bacterium]
MVASNAPTSRFPECIVRSHQEKNAGEDSEAIARLPIRADVRAANRDATKCATETVAWVDDALGQEEPSKLGTATQEAVALALFHMRSKGIAKTDAFADRWAQHGLAFATEVAMESYAIKASCEGAVPKTLDDQIEYAGANRWEKYNEPMYLVRLRGLLAIAPDEEHAGCVEVAQGYLVDGVSVERMIAIAYLFPELRCVEMLAAQASRLTDTRHDQRKALLLASVGQIEHLKVLQENFGLFGRFPSASYALNVFENFGADAPEALTYWLDAMEVHGRNKKVCERLTFALALCPNGSGLSALVARRKRKGAMEALEHVLQSDASRVADIEAAVDKLPKKAQAPLLPLLRRHAHATSESALDPAPLGSLPKVLRPLSAAKAKAPKRIKGLATLAQVPAMAWRAGERKTFVGRPKLGGLERSELEKVNDCYLMAWGPDDLSRTRLRQFRPTDPWGFGDWLRPVVARYELDSLDLLATCAKVSIADALPALMPFDSASLAPFVAHGATLKKSEKHARKWLVRHPRSAAIGLIPAALGGTGKAKKAAVAGIAILAEKKRKTLLEVATEYGDEVLAALEALVALPAKEPVLPKCFAPDRLPKVLTKSGSHRLPESALRRIGTVLATRKRGRKNKDVEAIREACDEESLAEMIWEAFEAFLDAGAPSKARWVMEALGVFGTDLSVKRLSPLLRTWSKQSEYQLALTGLEVLEELGSDEALRALMEASEERGYRNLRVHGGLLFEAAAKRRKVAPEELAELVLDIPDLPDKTVLDFGPRRFYAQVEHLELVLTDDQGMRRPKLPPVAKRDDSEKATRAIAQFRDMRTKLKNFVVRERRRLEEAMCEERAWAASEFRERFVSQALRMRVAAGLVWSTLGASAVTFRVALDGTLEDALGEEWQLPPDAKVVVAHPARLAKGVVSGWTGVFADYELVQPFEQLRRSTGRLADDEAGARESTRWQGKRVPAGAILSLQRHGWTLGDVEDGGEVYDVSKTFGSVVVTLSFDPGVRLGEIGDAPLQRLGALRWTKGVFTPVAVSETIRELERVADTR